MNESNHTEAYGTVTLTVGVPVMVCQHTEIAGYASGWRFALYTDFLRRNKGKRAIVPFALFDPYHLESNLERAIK